MAPYRYHSVDLGGTRIEHALADNELSIRQRMTFETESVSNPGDWIQAVTARVPATKTIPWMIGVPSPVEHRRRITETPNLPAAWSGGAIVSALEQHEIDYRLENDANLAAYGEWARGNHGDLQNLVLLTLGTGVGCGIIIGGELYRGSTGGAGELGHIVVEPGGRPCGCGNRGCLERYASATGLAISYSEITGEDCSAKQIMDRVTEEDARRAAETTGRHLGRGIALVVNLLEPQKVVLGGGLAGSFEKLRSPVRTAYRENVFASRLGDLPIKTTSIDVPALHGGIALLSDG